MKKKLLKPLTGNRGFSILEVLIAAMITGIITAAAFSFYVRMHSTSEAQFDIAETQHLCRASLHDIKKNLRMAGYKLPAGHEPFEVNGDSLIVYRQGSQPVDTITYYLQEFTESEYFRTPNLPVGRQLFKLMKQTNSQLAQVFADYIYDISFTQISPSSVELRIDAQTMREDMSKDVSHTQTDGGVEGTVTADYNTYFLNETVKIRNITS